MLTVEIYVRFWIFTDTDITAQQILTFLYVKRFVFTRPGGEERPQHIFNLLESRRFCFVSDTYCTIVVNDNLCNKTNIFSSFLHGIQFISL